MKTSGEEGSVLPQGQLLCHILGYRGAVDREPLRSQAPRPEGKADMEAAITSASPGAEGSAEHSAGLAWCGDYGVVQEGLRLIAPLSQSQKNEEEPASGQGGTGGGCSQGRVPRGPESGQGTEGEGCGLKSGPLCTCQPWDGAAAAPALTQAT